MFPQKHSREKITQPVSSLMQSPTCLELFPRPSATINFRHEKAQFALIETVGYRPDPISSVRLRRHHRSLSANNGSPNPARSMYSRNRA